MSKPGEGGKGRLPERTRGRNRERNQARMWVTPDQNKNTVRQNNILQHQKAKWTTQTGQRHTRINNEHKWIIHINPSIHPSIDCTSFYHVSLATTAVLYRLQEGHIVLFIHFHSWRIFFKCVSNPAHLIPSFTSKELLGNRWLHKDPAALPFETLWSVCSEPCGHFSH